MTDSKFHVRRMNRDEVGLIREWATAEGWDPGLHDGPAFHAADPEGLFIGLLGETPVGCASAIRYGDGFGFFGQYIVRPAYRGIGYGLDIGRAGLAHLEGRNMAWMAYSTRCGATSGSGSVSPTIPRGTQALAAVNSRQG